MTTPYTGTGETADYVPPVNPYEITTKTILNRIIENMGGQKKWDERKEQVEKLTSHSFFASDEIPAID